MWAYEVAAAKVALATAVDRFGVVRVDVQRAVCKLDGLAVLLAFETGRREVVREGQTDLQAQAICQKKINQAVEWLVYTSQATADCVETHVSGLLQLLRVVEQPHVVKAVRVRGL